MSGKFTADVNRMVINTEKRMEALARKSIQRTINDAQLSTKKGGRMRVDTGFLRASGQPSYNGMPSGPTRGTKTDKDSYNYQPEVTELALSKLTIGQIFYFGWTANYAKFREAYDGFMSTAAQRWPQTVEEVTNDIRKRTS